MFIHYILRYTESRGYNWITASPLNSDVHKHHYREYAPMIHYCFLGIENKTIYYASPQGGRGEVTLRIKEMLGHTSECGLQFRFVMRNQWYHETHDRYVQSGHGKLKYIFQGPDSDEIYGVLKKVISNEEEIKKIMLDITDYAMRVERNAHARTIREPTREEHFYNLELQFDNDTRLSLMLDKPCLFQEPVSRCVFSNHPFPDTWVHPEINGAESRAMEILLGKIDTSTSTDRLNDLCESVFASGNYAKETVFIVNNPDADGRVMYPNVFYMARLVPATSNDESKYSVISTASVAKLPNGVYSFKGNGGSGWECVSIEHAIDNKLLFYTMKDVVSFVNAHMSNRDVNLEEIRFKEQKLNSDVEIQKYKHNVESQKSSNSNLVLITTAVSAVASVSVLVIKYLITSSTAVVACAGLASTTASIVVGAAAVAGFVAYKACQVVKSIASSVSNIVTNIIPSVFSWAFSIFD